ncbi:MAG: F0F1 ATP synthase subunit B [Prochlorococcaceae cyanobacterium]|jgi:F-type H+-transporting ATPase subunit b
MFFLHSLVLADHGFGINTNILDTNIINLAIVVGVLVWFLRGFLGGILQRRREAVLADLRDAEQRLAEATTALAAAQKELTQAQATAQTILSDGRARAQGIREQGEQRTIAEMARVQQDAQANLAAEAARVSEALRLETARAAVAKALEVMPGRLDAAAQARIIDRSLDALG